MRFYWDMFQSEDPERFTFSGGKLFSVLIKDAYIFTLISGTVTDVPLQNCYNPCLTFGI